MFLCMDCGSVATQLRRVHANNSKHAIFGQLNASSSSLQALGFLSGVDSFEFRGRGV